MTPKNILSNAKTLLQTHGWTQSRFARRADDSECEWRDPDAVCFCLLGAVNRAAQDLGAEPYHRMLAKEVLERFVPFGIVGWNDTTGRTKEEVLAVLAQAEELAP